MFCHKLCKGGMANAANGKYVDEVQEQLVSLLFFRKYELYSMEWKDHMKISDFTISCATYGGPIGM